MDFNNLFSLLIESIFTPHVISINTYLFMTFLVATIVGIIILLYKIFDVKEIRLGNQVWKRKPKKMKANFTFKFIDKYNKIKELKRKYNIYPFKTESLGTISFESLFLMLSFFITLFFAMIFIILNISVFVSIFPGVILGVFFTIFSITIRYENRKKSFEKAMPEMGMTINQVITNKLGKREVTDLFQKLINMEKYPVSEEFTIIKNDFEVNGDMERALNNIINRYPESQYLPRLKDFFEIYYDTKSEEIADLIEITVRQIEDQEEVKKKAEIEIAPFIRVIYIIAFIAFGFLTMYILTNKLVRNFYQTKEGIVTLIICLSIVGLGFFVIRFLEMQILKDTILYRKNTSTEE